MGCGSVAFVAGEAILRMFDVVGFHQIIAVRFGEDGGGRDGGAALLDAPEQLHRIAVSYTHLRAHETVLDLVCRLLLEQKTHIERPALTHNAS